MHKILSRFSKGIRQSRALSFAPSASFNCEKTCKQIHGACYALQPEKQYRNYGRKLIRHALTPPANLVNLARYELTQTKKIKWFRLSVSGSVPSKGQVNKEQWGKFATSLRGIVQDLLSREVKIHFPVESFNKARTYRSILKGLPVVVRRTIQSPKGLNSFNDHCAYVVGDKPGIHNVSAAFKLADALRQEGKTVVVCPAINGVSKFGKSKCGLCTACSSEKVSLVIYPLH